MIPLPGTGEILMILLLLFIAVAGERVGAVGDAIGRMRLRGEKDPTPPAKS